MIIRRGEIYLVNLDPTTGREQRGTRPVLVVSTDAINRQPLVVMVVAGTKGENIPRDYPSNVRVSAQESGLKMETVFMCYQVRSLDKSRFPEKPSGELPPTVMAAVDQALRFCLAL
jgi:mRNA interferase MazF